MKNLLTLILICCTFGAFAQSLNTIESVEYDEANQRFLVSNNSNIISINYDGSLSFFGSGASANYGMEVMGNTLFAIKNSQVRGYDLTTGMEVMSISIPGAGFLNGMANDGLSKIYVTDFGTDKIHEIDVSDFSNPSQQVIVSNTVETPNGMVYDADNNRLIFVTWGSNAKIKAVDPVSYQMTTLETTGLGNIDGIDNDNSGNFYIASWSPQRITRYNSDFSMSEVITAPGLSNPADICYAKSIDTLAIPNSGSDLVTFIGFQPVDITNAETPTFGLQIYPNPATPNSVISYQLDAPKQVALRIFDTQGRLVHSLIDEAQAAVLHRVLLSGLAFETGIYFCELQVGDERVVERFLVK